ncbi:MAG: ROK family protein [Candidatus Omnitrophota bacterium]|nr:MAG: ROK family protein [Candidatus Omnitrophota bacterium]
MKMERRESIRLEKTLPVKFDLPDVPATGSVNALARNIAEGGIFIETDLVQDEEISLVRESPLNLEFELLGHIQRIKPKARIAWISRKSATQKERNGFGVRFIQLGPREKRIISLFISRESLAKDELVEKETPVISGEQKLTDRQRRNLKILDVIRKNRLISRAEISKSTGINIVTVSNYIDTYLKKGLVFERGLDISTGGRRPELVEINPDYGYAIGVDLGPLSESPARIAVAAVDFTGRVKASALRERGSDNIEDSVVVSKDLIKEILANDALDKRRVRGIGLGISGIMDKFGGTVRNPSTKVTYANYLAIKKELEDEFGLPVFIENATSCALFAEKWVGLSPEARAADNIIYIFSEHQCAIMLKGELYTGTSKSAGLLNLVQDLGISLDVKIAYLVNIFNPQVVVIGRNFFQSPDAFSDTIRRTVSRWAFREGAQQVRIIPATLEETATARGAASLVIEAAFANI